MDEFTFKLLVIATILNILMWISLKNILKEALPWFILSELGILAIAMIEWNE